MTDFSRIFRPASPSRAHTPRPVPRHASGRVGNHHFFHHLDAWEREIAAGEVQREQQDGHRSAQGARNNHEEES